jgi:hypothetical protein
MKFAERTMRTTSRSASVPRQLLHLTQSRTPMIIKLLRWTILGFRHGNMLGACFRVREEAGTASFRRLRDPCAPRGAGADSALYLKHGSGAMPVNESIQHGSISRTLLEKEGIRVVRSSVGSRYHRCASQSGPLSSGVWSTAAR